MEEGQEEKGAPTNSTKTSSQTRPSLKNHPIFNNYDVWKCKLRENCYKRVRENRRQLLWKLRGMPPSHPPNFNSEDTIKSTFQDIVSSELKKLKDSSSEDSLKMSTSSVEMDDMLWEYNGLYDAYQGECEEILLEMQKIFYEDLREESTEKEPENNIETWEDEEDEFLANAVYEHMQLNDKQLREVIWCPICKQGELKEKYNLIYCTLCKLQLKKSVEVSLELLRSRLSEVHAKHLDQGCLLKPKFCVETGFDITALYIVCAGCSTFEVVV